MRPRVAGMNEVDDLILEFFQEQDESIALSPAIVWFNLYEIHELTDKSKETVSRRMRTLVDRGLLKTVDETRGYRILTDKGRAYLAGDLDAEDLQIEE